MSTDIKKIIAQEYIKCAKDPSYFMKKYCYIQHPTRGRILFNLYPFQSKVLHLFRDEQYIITLKSRQLGISTLASAYSLWLMLFHKDKNVLALATTINPYGPKLIKLCLCMIIIQMVKTITKK